MRHKLLKTGMVGTVFTILCCATPVLPWLLGALGLSGMTGYIYRDSVLLPVAAFFLVLTGYALWRRRRARTFPD